MPAFLPDRSIEPSTDPLSDAALPGAAEPARRRFAGGTTGFVSALALAATVGTTAPAAAAPGAGAYLFFDARTGEVLSKYNADQAWYPASITKLMTTYVTLQAMRAGRLRPTSPVVVSAAAAKQPPSKMGFPVGTVLTVDNALKMIMVKSANDIAWALGEAVGGSKEDFVTLMNREARRLGMNGTHWGNPNGLPDTSQVTTARDLGILARALLRDFPERTDLYHIPGIQIGGEVIKNHNHLLDRFPGTDGMKTGFICSAGFNVVATVTRGDRKLVGVVLGSPSTRARAELAAQLFTQGFESSGGGLFGGFGGRDTIETMARGPEAGRPVKDIKEEVCGKKKKRTPDVEEIGEDPVLKVDSGRNGERVSPEAAVRGTTSRAQSYLTARFDIGPPIPVWVGGADPLPNQPTTALALASTGAPPLPIARSAGPAPTGGVVEPVPMQARAPGAIMPNAAAGRSPEIDPNQGTSTARAFALFRSTPEGASVPVPEAAKSSADGIEANLPPSTGMPLRITELGSAPTATSAAAAQPGAEPLPIPRPKPAFAETAPRDAAPHKGAGRKPKNTDG